MRSGAVFPERSRVGRGRRLRVPSFGWAIAILAIVLEPVVGGCSCSRRPEWDSGLTRQERPARQAGGTEAGGSPAPGTAGSGSGSGSGGGEAGGGETGTGAGGGSNGSGEQGRGDEAGGPIGGDGTGSAGGAAEGSQAVPGPRSGDAAGAGDDAAQPPAALPGRPRPKPRYDASTAAAVAERQLQRAEDRQRQGDFAAAYTAAVEAFEAVEPHAATDDSCKAALARAKQLLTQLADRQNRKARPREVPTLFE